MVSLFAYDQWRDQFRILLESAPDPMVIADLNGIITLINAQAEELFGYSAGELIGSPIEVLLPERFRNQHVSNRAGYENKPRTRMMGSGLELYGRRRDGTEVPVEISLSPIETADGRFVASAIRDITEAMQRRIETEEIKTRLSDAQRMAQLGSFEINLQDGSRWWSDEFWRILGIESTEHPSRYLMLDAVHEEDREYVRSLWERADAGQPVDDFACRIVHPNGRVHWMRTRISPEVQSDGAVVKIRGTAMDVTDLHVAEEQRREAEKNFRLGFERSPIGIGMSSLDGCLTRINSAVSEILGRDRTQLLGKTLHEFLHPIHLAEEPLTARILNGGDNDLAAERRYLRPDGELVWVEETVSLVRTESGEPTSFFFQLQDVSSRKRAEEELEHQAFHDPLTGLANRLFLTEQLTQSLALARRSGHQVGVLFIDVDQFKLVNDARGHAAGDDLLVQLVNRLKAVLRPSDTFARFGGDEFVIVCNDITSEDAQGLAARIVTATKAPLGIDGQDIFVTVSIGIVLAAGDDDAESVLRKSDVAMYEAKDLGRARAVVFDEVMQHRASERMDIESQLGGALDRGEFRLLYQPIVDVATEQPVGFEALVRWQHPERGLLSPAEFIPIAEETGMILDIGDWVLEESLAQLASWQHDLAAIDRLSMAVNLSTIQLQDARFAQTVGAALTASGISPSRLHLEVTESMVMSDVDLAVRTLLTMRDLGVRLSIDDFGTGHSSLGYLQQLPVHSIKIDRSFVKALDGVDRQAASIVDAIVSLARALNLDVIGEGVETRLQHSELHRLGSRLGQGYLWSKPLTPSSVPGWLARRPLAGG